MEPPTRRERILDVAVEEFGEKGFAGARIREIERRAGLRAGTGSLYRHFESKEALLQEAVAYEVARCRADLEAARATLPVLDDPEARRRQRFELILHELGRWQRLFRLMLTEGERVPELAFAVWDAVQRPVEGDPERAENIADAVAMTSLGGYYFFSLMQGRPFNDVSEARLIEALLAMTSTAPDLTPAERR
jgi:AcrR family transcriptional regulator